MAKNRGKPVGWMITNDDGWACEADLEAFFALSDVLEDHDGIRRHVVMGESVWGSGDGFVVEHRPRTKRRATKRRGRHVTT